jgi:transposase
MPAPLHIQLTPEEERTLSELRTASTVPYRTRDRAHVLRLNANGWTVEKIAECFNWHEQTVRQTIHRWEKFGLGGLWEAPGRGAKPKWQEADLQYLEQSLEQEQRTYNSEQLAKKLASDRQVELSPDRIRRVLKKRGSLGSGRDTVIAASRMREKSS